MNRTKTQTVTFARAFSLIGVEGVHAPGTYAVEVDEELLSGLSFPVYRRMETRMVLPWRSMAGSGNQTISVNAEDLDAALARDAADDAADRR